MPFQSWDLYNFYKPTSQVCGAQIWIYLNFSLLRSDFIIKMICLTHLLSRWQLLNLLKRIWIQTQGLHRFVNKLCYKLTFTILIQVSTHTSLSSGSANATVLFHNVSHAVMNFFLSICPLISSKGGVHKYVKTPDYDWIIGGSMVPNWSQNQDGPSGE